MLIRSENIGNGTIGQRTVPCLIERVTPIDNYYSKLNILKGLNEYGR